ncbi:hypothetical protein PkoCFBP13504_02210 [Pseudomonas koreensis]|nr:hypothetical protein PkoCFBP13504_02210 [Pseudomonas koreensis]
MCRTTYTGSPQIHCGSEPAREGALSDTPSMAWPLWHGPCVPVIQVLRENCRCVNSIHPPQPRYPKVQQIEQ